MASVRQRNLRWQGIAIIWIASLVTGTAVLTLVLREVGASTILAVPSSRINAVRHFPQPPPFARSTPEQTILSYFVHVDHKNRIVSSREAESCATGIANRYLHARGVAPVVNRFIETFISGALKQRRVENLTDDLADEIGPSLWGCPATVDSVYERRIEKIESQGIAEVVAYLRITNTTSTAGLREQLTLEEAKERSAGQQLRFTLRREGENWLIIRREAWEKNWDTNKYEWTEFWRDRVRESTNKENHYPYTGVPATAYE